jgi:predicted Rossmann fold flavoprotein
MSRDLTADIAIIGGGAAGFFAAITAAKLAGSKSLSIAILEKAKQPLGKVLISGGGRCNVTYACFEPAQLVTYYPRGADALRGAFSRFQPADTIAWFESHGVPLKTEPDGRVFPQSDSSRSIVNCLLSTAQSAGVEVRTSTAVESVELIARAKDNSRFLIHARTSGRIDQQGDSSLVISAHRVLFATGGDRNSLSIANRLGHTIEPPVPSLFSFNILDHRLEGLAGLTVDPVHMSLEELALDKLQQKGIPSQQGPVLVTHWGLSGPAVLKLSAWGARWLHDRKYRAGLRINWLPPLNIEQVVATFTDFRKTLSKGAQKISTGGVFEQIPRRLWNRIITSSGISENENWAHLTRFKIQRLAEELTQALYQINGKGPFKDEFVTCGGIKLDEINLKTMESRLVPGLFFAGEIIDIDGLTGGFNFQNAWTTGWLAGQGLIASRLISV